MKKAPVHAIYKRYDAFFVIHIARIRVFAGMKWKFFCVRKRCERTFIHNLCPLCGRRGAPSADRVGRDPCVPPRQMRCSAAGHMGPALRTLSLRASPRREASALGVQTGAAIRFPSARPLDKPAGMGIIINRRGRCDKRSAPQQLNDYFELFSSQKPSPCRVAVFAFQSLDSYRDRMTQNMNRENEKHVCHPLSGL